MPKEIDQRAQRHDPASTHTHDSNDRPDNQTKQPGKVDKTPVSPAQTLEAEDATKKHNQRDDGRGEVTTDEPLKNIADANK
ncbi:hypothetical protein CDV52_20835 [Haematobacter missouriensis]|uniref:Uncharacterized protein n=2 Tax=Haematobacter TaxID=366614 RepID=A0A086XSI8_9RHOB|nr:MULTISPECIES: hypothetical protein [Haematobacter]KFI24988.1 hypothetical protein CN97_11490 [Haematobacter massiliensis]OWJ70662.1 hypothetical protein CDV50_12375 [Haematobacter massiliensis]OWJ71567.1 hypothetical protein CDV53_18655 [Haematobacter missouriensis]OWJ80852.1 hypothetical protein CDV52_20835 [Haematobacter missouriensis]OWJ81521.1 hypothetical protein CDV51_19260 [Haematobacter massiliensis]